MEPNKMKTFRSDSIANLAAALAIAQGQMPTAKKDNVAKVKMRSGGEFSYRYATLDDIWDACRAALSKNGLAVVQIPSNDDEGFFLETILAHSSGEWVSSVMKLPVAADRMSELQAMGSAITYARRYMLSAMVGVTTGDDDDDGQIAAQSQQNTPKTTMTVTKLLKRLNQESDIKGVYNSVGDLKPVLGIGENFPEPADIESWKDLFQYACEHARNFLVHKVEERQISPDETMPQHEAIKSASGKDTSTELEELYPDIFEDAQDKTSDSSGLEMFSSLSGPAEYE
jgi:hypothetical protein